MRRNGGRATCSKHPLLTILSFLLVSPSSQVRQYVFAGELKQGGELSAMRLRIPQTSLPSSITEAILVELDVQTRVGRYDADICLPRLVCPRPMFYLPCSFAMNGLFFHSCDICRLLLHLETCIRFIAAIGTGAASAAVEPTTPLAEFACSTLSIDEHEWQKATTSTINDLVRQRQHAAAQQRASGLEGEGEGWLAAKRRLLKTLSHSPPEPHSREPHSSDARSPC